MYLCYITSPHEGLSLPGDAQLYLNKVMTNWQLMATFGNFFPRISFRDVHLFSHQSSEKKRHPGDPSLSV